MNLLMFLLQVASVGTALALSLAAGLAPFLTNLIKNKLGVDSLYAYGIHLAISSALAVGALFYTGELTFANFGQSFPLIATVSTTVFQFLKTKSKDESAPDDGATPAE